MKSCKTCGEEKMEFEFKWRAYNPLTQHWIWETSDECSTCLERRLEKIELEKQAEQNSDIWSGLKGE